MRAACEIGARGFEPPACPKGRSSQAPPSGASLPHQRKISEIAHGPPPHCATGVPRDVQVSMSRDHLCMSCSGRCYDAPYARPSPWSDQRTSCHRDQNAECTRRIPHSGRQDSNLRLRAPKARALAKLSYAPVFCCHGHGVNPRRSAHSAGIQNPACPKGRSSQAELRPGVSRGL